MNSWSDTPRVPTLSFGSTALFGMIGHVRQCGSIPERALTVALPLQSGFSGMQAFPSLVTCIPGSDSQRQALIGLPRPPKPQVRRPTRSSTVPAFSFPKKAPHPDGGGSGHAAGPIFVFGVQDVASPITPGPQNCVTGTQFPSFITWPGGQPRAIGMSPGRSTPRAEGATRPGIPIVIVPPRNSQRGLAT